MADRAFLKLSSSLFAAIGCCFVTPLHAAGTNALAADTLGLGTAIPFIVRTSAGKPICNSLSFSQVPGSATAFIGKYREGNSTDICAGPTTLGSYTYNWTTHVMTFDKKIVEVPLQVGDGTLYQIWDPTVAVFQNRTWVAFECGGPHIPGTSSCVAPLINQTGMLDTSRISIPVVGANGDDDQQWTYSASTPKLLTIGNHLYMYWTAIQSAVSGQHQWNSIQTRGVEMDVDPSTSEVWVKGRFNRPLRSKSSGFNVMVMGPVSTDPYRDQTVDTEGLLVEGGHLLVASSVGGKSPTGSAACVTPLDKSPGCFRLEISEGNLPLEDRGLQKQIEAAPLLPANSVEYPRFAKAPDGSVYLTCILHPVQVGPAPGSGATLSTGGYVMIPLNLQQLKFVAN